MKTTHAHDNGFTPEIMTSIVVGNDALPIDCVAVASGAGHNTEEIGPLSDLVSCVRYTAGVPVADIVDTATIPEVGKLDPGVDINNDTVVVTWLHYPGDGDPFIMKG